MVLNQIGHLISPATESENLATKGKSFATINKHVKLNKGVLTFSKKYELQQPVKKKVTENKQRERHFQAISTKI